MTMLAPFVRRPKPPDPAAQYATEVGLLIGEMRAEIQTLRARLAELERNHNVPRD